MESGKVDIIVLFLETGDFLAKIKDCRSKLLVFVIETLSFKL